MELTITKKAENILLERFYVEGKITFEGPTPNNNIVTEALSRELGIDSQLVVVKHIYTTFSKNEAKIEAVAYKNKKARAKFEVLTVQAKKKLAEEAKKTAEEKKKTNEEKKKAAEAAKAEAPKSA